MLKFCCGLIAVLFTASTGTYAADEKEGTDKDGVVTTKTGLKYKELKVGDGDEAKAGKTVVVHYTGTFTDGWARTGTPGLTTGTVGPLATGNGLPILGKSFARASNPAVALGISANFGASWEHRYVRP